MSSSQDPQAWLETWLGAQRDAWQKFFAAPAAAPPPSGPAQFMALSGGQLPQSADELTRKLLDFGEGYLGIAREFWKVIETTRATHPGDATALRDALEPLRRTFSQGFSRLYGAPAGTDLLEMWQKLGALAPAGLPGLAPLPGMSAFGPAAGQQAALQRIGAATRRYQQALQRFADLLGRVSGEAVERLAKALLARAEGGEPPGSLRAVYDLWVDSGEQAYAAAAHGAEFAAAQTELNEALVELKSEQQRIAESWAKAFDLPTRSELNTILKRLNTVRRRVRELEEELEQLRRGR